MNPEILVAADFLEEKGFAVAAKRLRPTLVTAKKNMQLYIDRAIEDNFMYVDTTDDRSLYTLASLMGAGFESFYDKRPTEIWVPHFAVLSQYVWETGFLVDMKVYRSIDLSEGGAWTEYYDGKGGSYPAQCNSLVVVLDEQDNSLLGTI